MSSIKYAYARFCSTRFPLPSEKQVADLEARLRISLPPDYRQYLLEYNGAFFTETEPAITPPHEDDWPEAHLSMMAGIGATHGCAELAVPGLFSPFIFDDNDPPQVFPIGHTLRSHLIYLIVDPGSEDHGIIGMKIAYSDKCYHLADGIEEFFASLTAPSWMSE